MLVAHALKTLTVTAATPLCLRDTDSQLGDPRFKLNLYCMRIAIELVIMVETKNRACILFPNRKYAPYSLLLFWHQRCIFPHLIQRLARGFPPLTPMDGRSCSLTSCPGSATSSWWTAASCSQPLRHAHQVMRPPTTWPARVRPSHWRVPAGAPYRLRPWCSTISCTWQPR